MVNQEMSFIILFCMLLYTTNNIFLEFLMIEFKSNYVAYRKLDSSSPSRWLHVCVCVIMGGPVGYTMHNSSTIASVERLLLPRCIQTLENTLCTRIHTYVYKMYNHLVRASIVVWLVDNNVYLSQSCEMTII